MYFCSPLPTWDAGPSQGYLTSISPVTICANGWRETTWSEASCLRKQHDERSTSQTLTLRYELSPIDNQTNISLHLCYKINLYLKTQIKGLFLIKGKISTPRGQSISVQGIEIKKTNSINPQIMTIHKKDSSKSLFKKPDFTAPLIYNFKLSQEMKIISNLLKNPTTFFHT